MNKENFFELGVEYIDAETDGDEKEFKKAFSQIKTAYFKNNKTGREILQNELRKLGIACAYTKNIFSIWYIDFEE